MSCAQRDDPGTSPKPYYLLNTVVRAAQVLDQFCGPVAELSLTELQKRLGFHKSVVHRLLMTLAHLGFLVQDPVKDIYRLGPKALELGLTYLRHSSLDSVAVPYMRRLLTRLSDFQVNLSVYDGECAICVESLQSPHVHWAVPQAGRRIVLHATAMGKVLLSHIPPEDLERYLATAQLASLTPNSICTVEDLRTSLDTIRAQGWALDDEESTPGRRCIGAPIRNRQGATVAALSISSLPQILTNERVPELSELVRSTCSSISQDLGYRAA